MKNLLLIILSGLFFVGCLNNSSIDEEIKLVAETNKEGSTNNPHHQHIFPDLKESLSGMYGEACLYIYKDNKLVNKVTYRTEELFDYDTPIKFHYHTFYKDYINPDENLRLKLAIPRIESSTYPEYDNWVKKITWYKIRRFKYIAINECTYNFACYNFRDFKKNQLFIKS